MKRSWYFLFIMIFASHFVNADTNFNDWLKNQEKEYSGFKEQRDKDFYSFLKGNWIDFDLEEGTDEDSLPKPVLPPVADQNLKEKPLVDEAVDAEEVRTVSDIKPDLKEIKQPTSEKTIFIPFFEELLKFPKIDALYNLEMVKADKDSAALFWQNFSDIDISGVISHLRYYTFEKKLNDWGYFMLARAYCDHIIKDVNTKEMLVWGIMLKSGYNVKIGFNGKQVRLLFTSASDLYSIPYFNLNGERYYLADKSVKSIKSYDASYEGADKKIEAYLVNRPVLKSKKIGERVISFDYKGKTYSFTGYFNPVLMKFMESLPKLSLDKYFLGRADSLVSKEFAEEIKQEIQAFSSYEKVNFILSLVQKSFAYKTDDEQFNYEKYFFPEEMIYYPYSDCEDRCALFACLIREITGFHVVILDYPGHVAAAVEVPVSVEGSFVMVKGKKFYIADPTYINSSVGMMMPEYRNVKPKILEL